MTSIENLDSEYNNTTDYLQKFGYRRYEGEILDRKSRITSLIWFEVKSTWHRSTFGKVLLVIIMVFNFLAISISAAVANFTAGEDKDVMRDVLNGFVASYLNFGNDYIHSSSTTASFNIQMNMGILIIALFAISGSGLFADDKSGKVIEIYLSRLQKREYIIGKIGAILIYVNVFLLVPLLIGSIIYVQSFDKLNHFEAIGFYLGVIAFCFLSSLLIGLGILSFSIISEKRQYASLGFFLVYLLGSIFGLILVEIDPDNEFLLLASPSFLLMLLAFVCLGDYNLGIATSINDEGFNRIYKPFLLNDGSGLEYWHVLGVIFLLIALMIAFLSIKIRRMTTEEL